ncbi:MAG: RNA degradosome polyphosphate kinase, partial [Nitrospira sp. SB0666_bin_27]|nr:RNA degradosome polyphosphate kinase [Nitrospira sp. SB0666_bin_27]
MALGSTETQYPAASSPPDLNDPKLYLNRELSWLQFNARVLEEAEDQQNPLLERVKFLSIFSSNLDEFFMIRISGLREQLSGGVLEGPPDGMTTSEQLAAVRQEVLSQLARFSDCWQNDILPKLNGRDIAILRYHQLKPKQQHLLRGYFSK